MGREINSNLKKENSSRKILENKTKKEISPDFGYDSMHKNDVKNGFDDSFVNDFRPKKFEDKPKKPEFTFPKRPEVTFSKKPKNSFSENTFSLPAKKKIFEEDKSYEK